VAVSLAKDGRVFLSQQASSLTAIDVTPRRGPRVTKGINSEGDTAAFVPNTTDNSRRNADLRLCSKQISLEQPTGQQEDKSTHKSEIENDNIPSSSKSKSFIVDQKRPHSLAIYEFKIRKHIFHNFRDLRSCLVDKFNVIKITMHNILKIALLT